jgi:hypothetical protein
VVPSTIAVHASSQGFHVHPLDGRVDAKGWHTLADRALATYADNDQVDARDNDQVNAVAKRRTVSAGLRRLSRVTLTTTTTTMAVTNW